MDETRIRQIYTELEQLRVPMAIPSNPHPAMLMEMLQACRRAQDRVLDLSVEVARAKSAASKGVRAAQAIVSLAGGGEHKVELRQHQDFYDDVRALHEVIGQTRSNLKITDSDIRLGAHLVDLQMKLGGVRPPEASLHAQTTPDAEVLKSFEAPPASTAKAADPVPTTKRPEMSTPVTVADVDDISTFFTTVKP